MDNASWLFISTQYNLVGNILDNAQQFAVENVDVRSKRRFRSEQERLNAVFENISPANNNVVYAYDFRILLHIR